LLETGAIVISVFGYNFAYAQDSGATLPTDAAIATQDIVVTAERRVSSLQTTAVSMSAISGASLDKQAVRDQADLQNIVPSLSVAQQGFTANVNIRGIGLNLQSATVVSGVALYRDGLFSPGSTLTSMPYYDISSIQVLRGPQGTFVGQNSTGGAILVSSNDPTFDGVGGNIEGQVGNYADARLRGAINLPISDVLSARAAFSHETRDSFYKNNGSDLVHPGNLDENAARLGLLWKPSEAFSALIKVEYYNSKGDGYAYTPIPGTQYAPYAPTDPFTLDYDRQDTRNNQEAFRVGLELKYMFGNGITLRSMSGYQRSRMELMFDEDATRAPTPDIPLPGTFQPEIVRERIVTQEFNLVSPDTGRFKWVLGGTYVNRDAGAILTPTNIAPDGTFISSLEINSTNPNEGFGLFGQGTFEIAPSFEIQAGLRWSHDKIDSTGGLTIIPSPPGAPSPFFIPTITSAADSIFSGKIGLNWKVSDAHFIYAFGAKGYKSGGPNLGSPIGFKPEIVWDYELGWKAKFFDNHLHTQINGFYMTYENFQVSAFDPETANTGQTNLASNSKIYGVEAQADARFGRLTLSGNFSYVHSRLGSASLIDTRVLPAGTTNQRQCQPGQTPPGCFDYSGSYIEVSGTRNPYSPEITANVGVEYEIPIGKGALSPRVDFTYIGAQYASVFANPIYDHLGERHLLNTQIAYRQGDWLVAVYGTNLTNEVYSTGVQPTGANRYLGAPRQVGIRVSRNF
jgi:iron complex outermembrane receptor protein